MRSFSTALLLCISLLLTGCGSINGPRADPLEKFNRATFAFNEKLDESGLKKVAAAYTRVTPQFLQRLVGNFFGNIRDVSNVANNALQGKFETAASDTGRVLANTTLGIFGLFDVATPMGLEKHNEDFGQTLARWGVPSGPYLILPFLGPSTLRDFGGRFVDSYFGYFPYAEPIAARNVAYAVELLDTRAQLLGVTDALEGAALDKYQFVRDLFLQQRLSRIYDGKVPSAKREELEESLDIPNP